MWLAMAQLGPLTDNNGETVFLVDQRRRVGHFDDSLLHFGRDPVEYIRLPSFPYIMNVADIHWNRTVHRE